MMQKIFSHARTINLKFLIVDSEHVFVSWDIASMCLNHLSTNSTKWSNTQNSSAFANELFESVWPFFGVGA